VRRGTIRCLARKERGWSPPATRPSISGGVRVALVGGEHPLALAAGGPTVFHFERPASAAWVFRLRGMDEMRSGAPAFEKNEAPPSATATGSGGPLSRNTLPGPATRATDSTPARSPTAADTMITARRERLSREGPQSLLGSNERDAYVIGADL